MTIGSALRAALSWLQSHAVPPTAAPPTEAPPKVIPVAVTLIGERDGRMVRRRQIVPTCGGAPGRIDFTGPDGQRRYVRAPELDDAQGPAYCEVERT